MPVCVIHGDTKMSNVLLDVATGEAVCVIDLDTVMPGLRLHDLGDCIREALVCSDVPAEGLGESEWTILEGILLGFFSELRPPPTASEIDHVATALMSITLELATRFLADYLAGDVYFRVRESHDNLRRAQRHIQLARNVERHRTELEGLVLHCAREVR
jgi:Ser/Thr protein kinase RdoA (MazF antagonist)